MASLVLQLDQVTVTFGKEVLLRSVQLEVGAGECFVLIGPSGQGKSVILKLLAGILSPTQGRVLVEGQDLNSIGEEERHQLQLKMGMLFQKNALFDSLTVGENIAFPLQEVTNLPADEIERRVVHFLDAVGIPHARHLYPDEISGGMQKRLGIARALALQPKIILYDDPTAGLDPITSRKIIELIMQLQKEHRSTIVAITNDMGRAYQMADRIGMVVDHSILIAGSVEQTRQHTDPRIHQFIRGELSGPLTESR